MTPRKALRVRQSTTAAAVSRTPAKDDDGHNSFGRRSLPRTAKVVAQLDGYQDQFNSPDKNHGKRKTQTAATPATKISQQMATVLTFESPENCRLGLRTERRSATVHRRLDLSSAKVTHDRGGSNHVEVERDENIPPMGDTVGRRLPKRTVKVPSTVTETSSRTPLRMKITKNNNSAKISSYSVRKTGNQMRYRSPRISSRNCAPAPPDARVMPVIVRLRSVVPHVDGTVEYRTVGSESPWGVKRSPAKVVFTTTLNPGLFSSRKCDLTFETGQLESSASEYSSDESDESGIASSEDGMEQENLYERRTSVSRNKITFKTIATVSPEKRRSNATHNPRAAVKKVQTLEDFRRRLHTAAVPERMPCREEEAAEVERFIRNAISVCGSSSAMYISGVPGTGKTATVMSVVKQLCRDKSCNKFCFVSVNAMEFIEPKKIFVEIYNQITGNTTRISPLSARKKLNVMFEIIDKYRPPIVILVDELDQLCTKKQELIYDIFNWTSAESARVSVMAIANTLDLPERMLCQRITSRIGSARICFQPYEFQQIECIIRDRLKGSPNAVDESAVQIAARKVAAVTGDLRKAMDLLRRAIEIAIEKGAKKLLVEHVLCATREASSTLLVHFVKGLSKHSLLLFKAAISLAEKTDDFSFAELYAQYASFAALVEGIAPLVESTLLSLVGQLCSF
ncbi:hypothetical protein RB195_010352 [Necator americanus]|uniref:Origin recognition complex subunit 1 n=1 Tax=Necator americanus TaxID=51031 RepID=A0ABR1CXL5_NECAM